MASFGWDLPALEAQGKLIIDHVSVAPDLREAGDWDLDGLLLRIRDAVEKTGARRLVLDTIEVLFSALPDRNKLRRSLRSLFEAVGEMGLATIVTAERGDGSLTRFGLEEYVSDCVILLDQRVTDQLATRRLHILKYRGSPHGLDEFPFLIDEEAVSVLPGTALRFEYEASVERVSSGLCPSRRDARGRLLRRLDGDGVGDPRLGQVHARGGVRRSGEQSRRARPLSVAGGVALSDHQEHDSRSGSISSRMSLPAR